MAQRYTAAFAGKMRRAPKVIAGGQSVWAQYVIEHENRDGLQVHLTASGLPSMVYYPVPIHQQDFAARFAPTAGSLPVTETASRHVLALPMHPYLPAADQDRVIETVLGFNR